MGNGVGLHLVVCPRLRYRERGGGGGGGGGEYGQ